MTLLTKPNALRLPGMKERGACALRKTSWGFPGSSRLNLAQHKTYGNRVKVSLFIISI